MEESSESSITEVEGSPSPVVSSTALDLAALREDVASVTAIVQSTLDMIPSEEEFLALVNSFLEIAKKVATKDNFIPVAQVTSSSKDQKKRHKGKGRAKKVAKVKSSRNVSTKESHVLEKETLKRMLRPFSPGNRPEKTAEAKADTNTPKEESSSNVSSKESDMLEEETLKRTCSSDHHPLVKTAEKCDDEGEEPAKKKAKAETNTPKKESSSNVFSKEPDVVTLEQTRRPRHITRNPLLKNADVGEFVVFESQAEDGYDSGKLMVKGYDPSLSEDDIARAVLEHFSPCGMVRRIDFQTDGTKPILRRVFIEMLEGFEAALKLNGSDLGGFKLEVYDAKRREEYYVISDVDMMYVPSFRRHERLDLSRFKSESSPPVYGIVPSRKINK